MPSSSKSKTLADISVACAAVLKHRKTRSRGHGKLVTSLEELSFSLNANVDKCSLEILDVVYLPLSLLIQASMEEKEAESKGEDRMTEAAATHDMIESSTKENVLLAGLDCLLAFVRALREGRKKEVITSQEIDKMTTSVFLWLSHFLQHHKDFSEEVNLKIAEILQFFFQRFLPLTNILQANGEAEPEGHMTSQVAPHMGCHIAFTLDQACHVSAKGSLGSKQLVKVVLASLNSIIKYISQNQKLLAFFLPGIVSKLSVLLLQAVGKSMKHLSSETRGESSRLSVTGPMANSLCIEQAVECLESVIVGCFEQYEHKKEDIPRHEIHRDKLQQIVMGSQGLESLDRLKDATATQKKTKTSCSNEFLVDCDNDWYLSSFQRVEEMLRRYLPQLCGHPSHVVRKCIIHCISRVMENCIQFETSKSFLECLLALSHDDDTSISDKASESVYQYGEKYQAQKNLQVDMLREVDSLFIDYVDAIVSSAKNTSSLTLLAKKISALLCLGRGSYMKHLYREMTPYLTKLIDALRQCFSFDVMKTMESSGPLIWVKSSKDTKEESRGETYQSAAVVLPRMHSNFAFLHNVEDYNAATMMCRTLGIISLEAQCTESVPVFDYIVQNYLDVFESCDNSSQMWYLRATSYCTMMSEMIVGCKENVRNTESSVSAPESMQIRKLKYLSSSISLMIEQHTSQKLWTDAVEGTHPRCAQLGCVLLESLGVFSRVLGSVFTDKYEFLPSTLYLLLDKFGEEHKTIQLSAELSLQCICYHCDYTSIADLLFQNSDYLIDTLVNQLMHLELYPRATRSFKAVVKVMQNDNCIKFLNLIREPFQIISRNMSVYARHLFTEHVDDYICILEVLSGVCLAGAEMLWKMHGKGGQWKELEDGREEVLGDELDMIEYPLGGVNCEDHKDIAVFIADTCSSSALQCAELLHNFPKFGCPPMLDSISCSIKALKLAGQIIEAIEKAEDGSDADAIGKMNANEAPVPKLLPTIASIWSQLMLLLQVSRKPLLIERCLGTITCIVHCGGKFLMSRVTKELWPLLNVFMKQGMAQNRIGPRKSTLSFDVYEISSTNPKHTIQIQCAALNAVSSICTSPTGRETLSHRTTLMCASTLTSLLKQGQNQSIAESLSNAISSLMKVCILSLSLSFFLSFCCFILTMPSICLILDIYTSVFLRLIRIRCGPCCMILFSLKPGPYRTIQIQQVGWTTC